MFQNTKCHVSGVKQFRIQDKQGSGHNPSPGLQAIILDSGPWSLMSVKLPLQAALPYLQVILRLVSSDGVQGFFAVLCTLGCTVDLLLKSLQKIKKIYFKCTICRGLGSLVATSWSKNLDMWVPRVARWSFLGAWGDLMHPVSLHCRSCLETSSQIDVFGRHIGAYFAKMGSRKTICFLIFPR